MYLLILSYISTESSKSPASIAKSNKEWVGSCMHQEQFLSVINILFVIISVNSPGCRCDRILCGTGIGKILRHKTYDQIDSLSCIIDDCRIIFYSAQFTCFIGCTNTFRKLCGNFILALLCFKMIIHSICVRQSGSWQCSVSI